MFLLAAETAEVTAAATGFDWRFGLVCFGVVMMLVILPRLTRRNFNARRQREKKIQREMDNSLEVKRGADRIMLDLAEASREINAQIDTKIRMLNRLIREAEEVSQKLERAMSEPAPLAPVAPLAPPTVNPEPVGQDYAQRIIKEFAAAAVPPPVNHKSDSVRMSARRRVATLHRDGAEASEIARRLQISLAEVNLIIDMKDKPEFSR
ncbi:hypothetical protein FACS1894139_16120 [Planctomycetales bacterium]|nr:hypothetical protein FACS1894107_09470 [Planctomycetales bacterium]GHT07582.1 hypothetical protein FACS1894139_16120 [Planctomycetales bacterium]